MSVNFNESFKALAREVFQETSESVDTRAINNLKDLAIKDIRGQIATNDFVRAEIAVLKQEFNKIWQT